MTEPLVNDIRAMIERKKERKKERRKKEKEKEEEEEEEEKKEEEKEKEEKIQAQGQMAGNGFHHFSPIRIKANTIINSLEYQDHHCHHD